MNAKHLKLVKRSVMRPVAPAGRKANDAYRVREHLTEAEMAKLLTALKANRYGHRDWLIGLLIYRHGLRVSEACDLRWDDIDLGKRTVIVRRLKGSTDSRHGGGPPSRERPSPLPLARPLGLVENVENGPDEGDSAGAKVCLRTHVLF